MRKLALIAIPLLLSLSGCAALGAAGAIANIVSIATPAKAVGDTVVLEGTRALVLAHNAVQGALAIVTPLIKARALSEDQVNRVEALVDQADRLFDKSDKALSDAERAASLMLVANELATIQAAGEQQQ